MDVIETLDNPIIFESLELMERRLQNPEYKKVMCSISGGSDSDILLDLCARADKDKKVDYVFFDTGLEYQATKRHLKYLEARYGVEIKIEKAVKPIPLCCREYGQPFLSKFVSEAISRLQRNNFTWEDQPLEVLIEKYPKCKSALKWWCNENGENSRFNIERHKGLKEFMIANPPAFKISNKCCTYAKKKVAQNYKSENFVNLSLVGIRKSEGGIRVSAYKSCFTPNKDHVDEYRPIFWYTESDKREYESLFNIYNSDCYTKYGLTRTGCAGCPYGKNFEKELEIIETHEPKLFKAVNKIFGDSYEYTRKYIEFRNSKNF
jgi:3'-phosphoadenosine 5'-phosphosulfate sulfotransferase (PAPS reductase)/FAD synthetase